MTKKAVGERYFVVRLSADDPEWAEGFLYEVQILDSKGRAEIAGYLKPHQEDLEIGGHVIPRAVVEAARRQSEGQGDYVDADGNSIRPF